MKSPVPLGRARLTVAATAVVVAAMNVAVAAPPEAWTEKVSPEAARTDLRALYKGLQSAHYDLYANRSRVEYDARFEQTMAALDAPQSRFELFLVLQKFTAFGNVAHARIDFPMEVFEGFRARGGAVFPVYPRIVDGRAYVGGDYSGSDDIAPGDEILSIDGEPMARWLERTSEFISADTAYIANSLLEYTFPLYLWVELGEREQFTLRVRGESGPVRQVSLSSRTREEVAAAADAAPEVFALDASSREARMLTDDIAYLRPGPFYNVESPERIYDSAAFADFIDKAFEGFLRDDARALVIDLRDNPGGDSSFSDRMISWIADRPFRFASKFMIRSSDEAAASNKARLDSDPEAVKGVSGLYAKAYDETPRGETFEFDIPYATPRAGERFKGEVYVLVNRHSYSNAVNSASIFQDYGWGVIAGELTADFATTYGSMEHFTLPETGFRVGFPKALIIRPSGDERPAGVMPDIAIGTPIAPSGEDVVLKRLVDSISGRDESRQGAGTRRPEAGAQ